MSVCVSVSVAKEPLVTTSAVNTEGMMSPHKKKGDSPILFVGRKLGAHSGYLPFSGNVAYSTQVSASLTNDISDILSFGFDRLHRAFKPDNFLSRFVLANVYYYSLFPIHLIGDMTRYQWATASRMAAVGLRPNFWDLGIDSEVSIYHGVSIWDLWSAPFRSWKNDSLSRALSVKRYAPVVIASDKKLFESKATEECYDSILLSKSSGLSEVKTKNKKLSVNKEEHAQLIQNSFFLKWNAVRLAAGHNDQSDRARELQNKSYWDECVYLDGSNYLRMRLFLPVLGLVAALQKDAHSANPAESDANLSLLESVYAQQGINLSSGKIAALSLLSALCSSSFYKTFRYVHWGYYHSGELSYRAYEWKGLRIPDVVPYLNSSGMSYCLTSGYRVSPTLIVPFSCEIQIVGDSAFELSFGVVKRFSNLWNLDFSANVSFGAGGVEGKVGCALYPWGNVAVESGINVYNSNMLEGRRRILSLKNGETDFEIFTKISLIY